MDPNLLRGHHCIMYMPMASPKVIAPTSLLPISIILVLFSFHPVLSLSCKSRQEFSTMKTFTNCAGLPYHNATLHWTYDRSASWLSMAFVAPPPTPDGWVAWAINPTGTGMVGAQALVAFKQSDGSMEVRPYNIHSYSSLEAGQLLLNVSDVSAEYDDESGNTVIFGTWELPEDMEGTLNHVWQVGPSVVRGRPVQHEFDDDNLASKGKLHLLEKDQSDDDDFRGLGESPEDQFGYPDNNGSSPWFARRNEAGPGRMNGINALGACGLTVSVALALFLY